MLYTLTPVKLVQSRATISDFLITGYLVYHGNNADIGQPKDKRFALLCDMLVASATRQLGALSRPFCTGLQAMLLDTRERFHLSGGEI